MTLTQALTSKNDKALSFAHQLFLILAGSLLLTLSAKISVPFYPVPQTMQTFVVVGLGLTLGPKLGVAAVLLYLGYGVAGLPVFSGTPEKGIGLAYMFGPTGGYLLGFVVAAWVAGKLAQAKWDRSILTAFCAALLASALIYVPGLLWLGSIVGWDKPVLAWGLYPFVLADLVKVVLAAAIFPAVWKWLQDKGWAGS